MEDMNINICCFVGVDSVNFMTDVNGLGGMVISYSKLYREQFITFYDMTPTDKVDLLHGIRDDLVAPIGVKCCGPAKHMLALLSGKIHTVACDHYWYFGNDCCLQFF